MQNLIDVVAALADAFDRLQIRFAIGGAIANNYWGIVRATKDVDCLISLPAIKYQLFADELNTIGFRLRDKDGQPTPLMVPRLREQFSRDKLVECHYVMADPPVRVELFVPAVALQEEILRRAVSIRMRAREVPVTTAEDLILLKLVFHRVKDLQDIRGILYVQRGQLDLEYMRHWSARTLESEVQAEMEQLIDEYSRDESQD
jgi:predicted nucleotidyltransferase